MKKLTVILLILAMLAGCGTASDTGTDTQAATQPTKEETAPVQSAAVSTIVEEMTLEQKVAQLFMIRPESLEIISDPAQVSNGQLTKYPVGGFLLSQSNIINEGQLVKFNAALCGASRITPFISTDEEGGSVACIGDNKAFNVTRYPSAGSVGQGGDPVRARVAGAGIGSYLSKFGLNMNLAPVADVNTNPDNPVVGHRAYSSDPEVVTVMAEFMATGLKSRNIIPVYKHFPGHGDTAEDSHTQLAVSNKTLEQLRECEWLPYAKLTEMDCVMVAHVALPSVTGDMTPATLSYKIVTEHLRQELGFQGVVMTDAMEMGAITNTYGSGEAAVKAIAAGCDMILCPQDFQAAYAAVLEAVKDGTLTEQRIDESVYRILTLKQAYGLL